MISTRRGYTVLPKPEIAPLTRSFGGGVVSQRPTISIAPRPTVAIPSRPTLIQPRTLLTPTARSGGAATRSLTRPAGDVTLLVPTARGATPSRGGITTTTGMPTGGLGLFSGIESDIRGTASGIMTTAKGFIPTAIKIIAAVVILKMVFWLLRRRR